MIRPVNGREDQQTLNIREIKLNDGNLTYNASSTGGIYQNNDDKYGTSKLSDSNKNTFYHSKDAGATLTITPTDFSTKLSKITVANRLDCCHDRLKKYELVIIDKAKPDSYNIVTSYDLKEVSNLYASSKDYTETFELSI
jgi:hypothetical protein